MTARGNPRSMFHLAVLLALTAGAGWAQSEAA